jgi:hypothetical protein
MDVLAEHSALNRWGDALDEEDSNHAAPPAAGGAKVPTTADAALLDDLAANSRQGLNLMFKQVREALREG